MKAKPCALKREDWDFSSCPEGLESSCWFYEFSREVPHRFSNDDGSYDLPPWFPDTGFPKTPFLLLGKRYLDHRKASANAPRMKSGGGSVGFGNLRAFQAAETLNDRFSFAFLHFDWRKPDKTLLRDFKAWLLENRPLPCDETRGGSKESFYMASLKSLGAMRLLKAYSLDLAIEHTSQKPRKNPLYTKRSDWYLARKKAQRILRDVFSELERGFWREDRSV